MAAVLTAASKSFSDHPTRSLTPVAFASSAPKLAGFVNPEADCTEIASWVAAMDDRLPTSLAEISSYPISYRRGIMGGLTPTQRTSVWREHLLTFLANGNGLEQTHRQFIESALADLGAVFENGGLDDEAVDEFRDHAQRTLGHDLAFRVFANIGPLDRGLFSFAGTEPLAGIKCSCNQGDDWCGSSHDCTSMTCDATLFGCGTWLLKSCNGLCYSAEMD